MHYQQHPPQPTDSGLEYNVTKPPTTTQNLPIPQLIHPSNRQKWPPLSPLLHLLLSLLQKCHILQPEQITPIPTSPPVLRTTRTCAQSNHPLPSSMIIQQQGYTWESSSINCSAWKSCSGSSSAAEVAEATAIATTPAVIWWGDWVVGATVEAKARAIG